MDLSIHSLEDLLLIAMKSEIEAKDFYSKVAERVKNFLLKDRLNFLAEEEAKHRDFFQKLFHELFPGKEIKLLEKSPVPLPELKFEKETVPISEVYEKAMEAEKAAYDFYMSLVDRFSDNPGIQKMLLYIATMEMGHYRLLEIERENVKNFEDFDIEWPMIHIGA